jgi:hypothetical protein
MSCCKKLEKIIIAGHEHFETSSACNQNHKRFSVVFKESKNQVKDHICRIRVDGGLISSSESGKCDFVFYLCSSEKFLFVELKGTDWPKPYKQIISTIEHFRKNLKIDLQKGDFEAFIIRGGSPASRTDINDKKDEFKRLYGVTLSVHTNSHNHHI